MSSPSNYLKAYVIRGKTKELSRRLPEQVPVSVSRRRAYASHREHPEGDALSSVCRPRLPSDCSPASATTAARLAAHAYHYLTKRKKMLLLLPLLVSVTLLPAVFAIKSIGLIAVVPDAANLGTYNIQAENGCKKAIARVADEYRCYWIFRPATVSPDREVEHYINEVAKDTTLFHLVTMLGPTSEVGRKLADRFPQITISANEVAVSQTDPPNIQGAIYNKYQSIFLAGVAAGAVTKSNNVAIIANLGGLSSFWNMYLRGILYVNPVATVQYRVAYDNTWSNKTWGRQLAQEEIDGGADVIFAAGGALGSAGIRYAASKKIWVIGNNLDESRTTFANKSEEASQYIIGSTVFDAERAVEYMLAERLAGDFVPGNKQFDVTNGGVSFAHCSSQISCAALNQSFTFIDTSTGSVNVQVLTISNLLRLIETRMKVGSLNMPSVRGGIHDPYLLNNGSWSMLHTFGRRPSPLYSHSFTPLQNGYIFAFGGQTDLSDVSAELYSLYYDFSDYQPVILAPGSDKPPGLAYHSAAFCNGTQELVIFGGTDAKSAVSGDLWSFSVPSSSWTKLYVSGGPGARSFQASASAKDTLYVFGGQDISSSLQSDLWSYHIPSKTWTQLSKNTNGANGPFPSLNAGMTVANATTLLLFGGFDGVSDLSQLWSFDLESSKWNLLTPDSSDYSPPGRSHMAIVNLDARRVLFIGGVSQSVSQSESFIYNVALNKYQVDSNLHLPIKAQGMTAFAYNQADYLHSCKYFAGPICTPINKPAIVMYGGSEPGVGVVGTMLITFPNDEILPKPPVEISSTIKAIGIAISSFGIIFCIAMFVVLIIFREHPAFKSASIMFLGIYLLGATVALSGMVIYSRQEIQVASCTAGLFTFSTGCAILYSCIFFKNLRIMLLFKIKKASLKQYIGNAIWGSALFIPVLINLGVLIAFAEVSPYKLSTFESDGDSYTICASDNIQIWMWILLIPVGLLILGALYIGFGMYFPSRPLLVVLLPCS
ncbi:hypothetical protein CcCBS67573_g07561 [Chytriomyces confervae]|uniref:G-protein coupled receptors family 3 profile domain-containing protein n=1 Tax=Chytriomyces confervae TaxID=246404 RepID=A0A507ET76_9FUNG|nr:hypothetical protein CcCBS67573_g07561 [Chytriomyces confervae]